jgi:hypothetical protein
MQIKSDILGESAKTSAQEGGTGSFKPPAEKLTAAIEALHHALAERGTDSLVLLGKKFHVMDNDGNRGLCYEEVWVHFVAYMNVCCFQNFMARASVGCAVSR